MNSSGSTMTRGSLKKEQINKSEKKPSDFFYYIIMYFKIRAGTFFLCPKSVTAKMSPKIHHTLCRDEALSEINRLAMRKQLHEFTL